MLRKLLALAAISAAGSVTLNAQDAPKNDGDKRIQSFVFAAPFERSYLGVQTVEISKDNFGKFGLAQPRGVGIEKVLEDSPAANAGLQSGDVIVRFEGEEVKSTSKLTRLIGEVAPDQTAKVTILRGGGEREFNVTLGKREASPAAFGNFDFENLPPLPALPRTPQTLQTPRAQAIPLPPRGADGDVFIRRGGANWQIGVGVTALTKQLGDYFGVSEGRGLLINSVRENSPAAKAGLKAGDIIVEVEGKEVKGQTDLMRAVNEKKDGDISLTILRDRNRQTVRVAPEMSKDGATSFDGFENLFETNPGQMNFRMLSPNAPLAPLPATNLRIAPRIL